MSYFDDGWIDERHPKEVNCPPQRERDAETVRREVEGFRGRILSATYGLERAMDALVLWHLFLNRQDGMAGFFEENILRDMGLDRKVKLVRTIVQDWECDGVDSEALSKSVAKAKMYRDRVAHWPTRLQPLVTRDKRVVDFCVYLEKGQDVVVLDEGVQAGWLAEIVEAQSGIRVVSKHVRDAARAGIFDE